MCPDRITRGETGEWKLTFLPTPLKKENKRISTCLLSIYLTFLIKTWFSTDIDCHLLWLSMFCYHMLLICYQYVTNKVKLVFQK